MTTRQMTLEEVPIAHATDPVTSYEAADAMRESGQRQRHCDAVMVYVRAYPGMTRGELGDRRIKVVEEQKHEDGSVTLITTWLDRYQVARRLTDLKALHRVYQGEKRICTVLGTSHMTWWPVGGAP
jgi:hypothetical protein